MLTACLSTRTPLIKVGELRCKESFYLSNAVTLPEYVKESDRLTLGMKVNIHKLPFYFVNLKDFRDC